jgi:hypothetical protein
MRLGHAPDDGDCFYHSLIQVAAPALAAHTGVPANRLTPKDVRRAMASHLIKQFQQANKPDTDHAALLEREPYLLELQSEHDARSPKVLDLSTPEAQQDFVDTVGERNAMQCFDLTPRQQTHVYNIAKSRLWKTEASDIAPLLATSTFNGIKLSVLTLATTATNKDAYTSGTSGPTHSLYLQNNHYVPAFPRA